MARSPGPADTLPAAWVRRWLNDPGATVLVDPSGAQVTSGMLHDWSAGVARRLAAAGVRRGDRVLLSADASVDLVVAYVALLRLGVVVVPANTAYTRPELTHLIEDSRPTLIVADRADRFGGFGVDVLDPSIPGEDAGAVPLDAVAPGDLAWLCYTSGTTGRPKGAMLSHANLLAGALAVVKVWEWTSSDRLVLALPLFHMHGLGVGINGTLTAGASVVLLPQFSVDAVLDAREAYGGTMFFGVPTMYARLAASPRARELAQFRLCVSGSAPLAPALWQQIVDATGVEVLERYGMTETVMLCSNPVAGPRVPGVVGHPLPGVELRLSDGGGVEVYGPSVFGGYWERTGATAAAFTADGWFRTGDIGEWAEHGLAIVGRTSELIISGGYNVYPREVEDAVRSQPGIADVAVVGVADQAWGERVVAYVVRHPIDGPPDDEAMDVAMATRLAPYKRPRAWVWVDALPRNAMGKVQRDALVASAQPSVGG